MTARSAIVVLPLAVCLSILPAPGGVAEGKQAYGTADYETAWRELEPVAEAGDAEAQFYVGFMLAEGLGVAEDDAAAAPWYRRSAEQGHVQARFNLGFLYEEGAGVESDAAEAVAWYELAAEQGLVKAQYRAADLYERGDGVPPDLIRAHMWFALAGAEKFSDARRRRKKVARRMTDKEIALAELEARLWRQRRREEKARRKAEERSE